MDKQQFVDALKLHAANAGAAGTISQWETPAGRLPDQLALDRSQWFARLSDEDRAMVEALARDAAHSAIFSVLCILDGVRRIDPNGDARLELVRFEQGRTTLLASSSVDAENLHDLL